MLEGFDESFDELFEEIATLVPCLPEKDAAFLRWRYGPGSPRAPATVLGVRDTERRLGYTVLWISGGQNGYLLDLTTLPGRRDVARALLRAAVAHCTVGKQGFEPSDIGSLILYLGSVEGSVALKLFPSQREAQHAASPTVPHV